MQFQGHDHGDVPAVSTCRVQSSTPFLWLVECVALKSAGANSSKKSCLKQILE